MVAIVNASAIIRSKSFWSSTKKLCLVHDNVMPRISTSWNVSTPIKALGTCPVNATTGIESAIASAKPVTRFVAPGPDVAIQTPTRAPARA